MTRSYEDSVKLWSEYINTVKKMLWDDFSCIGEQVMHGMGEINTFSWDYAIKHQWMEANRRPGYGSCVIDDVLNKARFLEDYFAYCGHSKRPVDIELVNWLFDHIT